MPRQRDSGIRTKIVPDAIYILANVLRSHCAPGRHRSGPASGPASAARHMHLRLSGTLRHHRRTAPLMCGHKKGRRIDDRSSHERRGATVGRQKCASASRTRPHQHKQRTHHHPARSTRAPGDNVNEHTIPQGGPMVRLPYRFAFFDAGGLNGVSRTRTGFSTTGSSTAAASTCAGRGRGGGGGTYLPYRAAK